MAIKASGYTWIAAGVVIAGALALAGMRRASTGAASAIGGALESAAVAFNPANPQNIVNQAVTAAGQAVTGESGWSLGGALYDWTHPFEGYQITGNPATLPWYAQPAGYGAAWGASMAATPADFQLSDLVTP
jgi:hypothetical protein